MKFTLDRGGKAVLMKVVQLELIHYAILLCPLLLQ